MIWQNILSFILRVFDVGTDMFQTYRYYDSVNSTYNHEWNDTVTILELTRNVDRFELFWCAIIILILTYFGQIFVHLVSLHHWATMSGFCCKRSAWNTLKSEFKWRHLFGIGVFVLSCIFSQITYFVNNHRVKTFSQYWSEGIDDTNYPDPTARCDACIDCPNEYCVCLFCGRNSKNTDLVIAMKKKSDESFERSYFAHVAIEDSFMLLLQVSVLMEFIVKNGFYNASIESLTFNEIPTVISVFTTLASICSVKTSIYFAKREQHLTKKRWTLYFSFNFLYVCAKIFSYQILGFYIYRCICGGLPLTVCLFLVPFMSLCLRELFAMVFTLIGNVQL